MRAELCDSLAYLYADSEVKRRPCTRFKIDAARGSVPSVHVLLNEVKPGAEVRLRVLRNGRKETSVQWFRLIAVPVEVNTGPVGFVENQGERNRHVARRAPFHVYDAMEPVGTRLRADASALALRLHLPIRTDARPGQRAYTVEVTSGRKQRVFNLSVQVHKPVVPATSAKTFPYTNWFSIEQMAERHGLKPWSQAHWRMIRRYAALMVHGRQNMFWLPLRYIFRQTRRGPKLDEARLCRLVKTFTAAGMHWIEGGHVASRTGGEWEATSFDVTLSRVRATSPEGNTLLASITTQLMHAMERHGWCQRWIQHVTDEPTAANAADYRILTGMVRKYMPGIPILDATMDPALVGSVDIWCPQAQEYQKLRKAFEAQRRLGDRIWFYTCCFPGGPWLNRLMDMELLRPTLLGWGAALYNLDGFLHWGLNHYKTGQDPFQMSVVPHGNRQRLPAGDTHIVYPGPTGPWPSVRLEAQREGFEDFELLRQLREQRPKRAAAIIHQAIRGFDKYTKDTTTFRKARAGLLRAVST